MRLTLPHLLLALVALLSSPVTARAAGPLEGSRLEPDGPAPREGQAFTYRLTLRADVDTTADVEVYLPSGALFVAATGAPGPTLDADGRVVRWQSPQVAGQPAFVTLTFLAGLEAGGHSQTTRVTLRPWQGEPTYLVHQAEVDSVPAPALLKVGGVGVTAAGVAVLAWLLAMPLLWGVLRVARPGAAAWATVAIVVPAGLLAYFLALAREDLRVRALPTTSCVVTDRVLDSRTGSSRSSSNHGPSTVYAPRLALLWMEGATPRTSQGFGTDSRLSRASASAAEGVLTRYAIGATVPCAIDDGDPRRAYVERGFGGAYLFALIPLPLLALGLWGITRGGSRS